MSDQNTGFRVWRGPSQTQPQEDGGFPVYNILLLGETGAGKSTTINAFANYMKYGSFEEAKEAPRFVQMIPSQFTLPDPENGEPILIHSGMDDDNERPGSGSSSTKAPVAYGFRFKDRMMRIIDTPGMGDTDGVNIDRENFDQILAHLHNYKQLHGILVLIKASETRKTAFFRYCITELLTHLHRSAAQNLVFCFTFSRNSFYGPGEGYTTLNSLLKKDLKAVGLTLKPNENCFFIDNEAYRFLVAHKQAYPFKAGEEESYKESWNRSVEQTNKMWQRMRNCAPHDLANTISLNNARKLILDIAEPMVLLQNMIEKNIEQISIKQNLLRNSSEDKEELVRNLNLEVDDLESRPLPYPRTVCVASKCTEVIKIDGEDKVNYKTHCHAHCYLDDVGVNTVGDPSLKNCAAMEGHPTCTMCGCDWQKHMHITIEYFKVKRTIIDSSRQIEIDDVDDAIREIEQAIDKMEELIKEYKKELKVIQDICAKFAVLLITNSNTPYNKFIDPYLELLMDEEQKKISTIANYSNGTFESLKRMRETHKENVKILEEAIRNNPDETIQLKDILKYKDKLFALKQTGTQFRQILEMGNLAKQKTFEEIPEKGLDLSDVVQKKQDNFWGKFLGFKVW